MVAMKMCYGHTVYVPSLWAAYAQINRWDRRLILYIHFCFSWCHICITDSFYTFQLKNVRFFREKQMMQQYAEQNSKIIKCMLNKHIRLRSAKIMCLIHWHYRKGKQELPQITAWGISHISALVTETIQYSIMDSTQLFLSNNSQPVSPCIFALTSVRHPLFF